MKISPFLADSPDAGFMEGVCGFFVSVSEAPEWVFRVIKVALILLGAFIIIKIVRWLVGRAMKRHKTASRRGDTLGTLLKSIVSYVVGFVALLMAVQTGFNIDLTAVIAAAGVLGIAVGFGAQTLVKDVISGFFLLFEDQFSVGDSVTIGSFTGVAEELGMRATRLRSGAGDLFIIPNGSISEVINHSRGPRGVVVQCVISYESDVQKALDTLKSVAAKAKEELPALTELPDVLGVGDLGPRGVGVRMLCRCAPGDQFALEREMLRRIKDGFDGAGLDFAADRVSIVQNRAK